MISGQYLFAQFAIMKTNCPKTVAPKKQKACKALCGNQAVSAQVNYFLNNLFNYNIDKSVTNQHSLNQHNC